MTATRSYSPIRSRTAIAGFIAPNFIRDAERLAYVGHLAGVSTGISRACSEVHPGVNRLLSPTLVGFCFHRGFARSSTGRREDIQYDFLKAVFDNEQCVFTNSYEPKRLQRQCFADLYIDTMSRSSKTSKVLRDKLLSDREAAKGMAMVCLLVNMGRMNTTLNCKVNLLTLENTANVSSLP